MTGHLAAAAPSVLKMSTKYEIIITFLKYRAICEKIVIKYKIMIIMNQFINRLKTLFVAVN